jgi:hypothetical protein
MVGAVKIMCVRFLSAGWSVVNFIVALTYGNVATAGVIVLFLEKSLSILGFREWCVRHA